MKKTIVLDFDGVIHGYQSGWKGARVIPDPPVPGALEFIVTALDHFNLAILSSRSHQWGGRRAMKRYLRYWLNFAGTTYEAAPDWWARRIGATAFADPWSEEVDYAALMVVQQIRWPLFKPAAHATLDDRALTFNGAWPSIESLVSFKPWNKR